ncbi:universal stress protein [bacterium]|nr:universal stress protein [bacterium]
MTVFKKILVAIDFSSYSNKVAEHAIRLAKELKSELIFINVLNQQQINLIQQTLEKINYNNERFSLAEYIEELVEERETEMELLVKEMVSNGISYKIEIHTGVPFKELLAAVEEHKADMVVMGAKGKTDIKEVLVGSTAIKMFRRCPVPLVSIREQN